MPDLLDAWRTDSNRALLLVGAVLLYVASRLGVDALTGGADSSGRRSVGHWLPIAAATLVTVAMRRGDLALSIIFSTSVATLSPVLGSIVFLAPITETPTPFPRVWLFAFPAALLTLLAGFAGQLTWLHALIFLAEGIILLLAWQEVIAAPAFASPTTPAGAGRFFRRVNVALCVALAVVGAVSAVLGAAHIAEDLPRLSEGATIVTFVAPLLVLPMLIAGASLAQNGRPWVGATAGVGVVLLNLCLLLPAVILLWYPVNAIHRYPGWHMDSLAGVSPLVFSWITWRVDNVVLLLLAFFLVPAALNRWRLSRVEGVTLVAFYIVYILIETVASLRS